MDLDTAKSCRFSARSIAVGGRLALPVVVTAVLAAGLVAPLATAATRGRPHLAIHPARRSSHRRRGCRDAHASVFHTPRAALRRAVVCLINQQRARHHLPRLRISHDLNNAAQRWTNVMVTHHDFTHGSDFAGRITASGFNWSDAGENIAAGFATPAAVVTGWMGSPGHCRNILTPTFSAVGTGLSPGSPGPRLHGTWTQDFALDMNRNAPSGNWGPANGCPY